MRPARASTAIIYVLGILWDWLHARGLHVCERDEGYLWIHHREGMAFVGYGPSLCHYRVGDYVHVPQWYDDLREELWKGEE